MSGADSSEDLWDVGTMRSNSFKPHMKDGIISLNIKKTFIGIQTVIHKLKSDI